MGFRSSILAGTRLIRQAINSPNYVPGVSGWTINRDGTAEFADLNIRSSDGSGRSIRLENGHLYVIEADGTTVLAEITPDASAGPAGGTGGGFVTYGTDVGGNDIVTALENGQLFIADPNAPTTLHGGITAIIATPVFGGYQIVMSPISVAGTNAPLLILSAATAAGVFDDYFDVIADTITFTARNAAAPSVLEVNTKSMTINGVPSKGAQADTPLISFAAATTATIAVVFATPFAAGVVPSVTTTIQATGATPAYWSSRAINVTNTGFNLFLYADRTGPAAAFANVPVAWIATPQTQ